MLIHISPFVGCCKELKRIGVFFIGVVKTAKKRSPWIIFHISKQSTEVISAALCADIFQANPSFEFCVDEWRAQVLNLFCIKSKNKERPAPGQDGSK